MENKTYLDFTQSLSDEEKENVKESLYLYFFENFEDEGQGLFTALSDQINSIEETEGGVWEDYYPDLVKLQVKLENFILKGQHE